MLILTAKSFNYTGHHHITLAAATELVHTASLLHDDVVDNPPCAVGAKLPMKSGAIRPAF